MGHGKQFTKEEAKTIGDRLNISWEEVDLEEFRNPISDRRRLAARAGHLFSYLT